MSEAHEESPPLPAHAETSLRARMAPWFAPLSRGESLPAGWRLLEWEAEQGITLLFGTQGRRLVVELERGDATRPAFARTQRFNVYYEALNRPSKDLAQDERVLLARVVDVLRKHEGELTPEGASPESRRIAIREIRVDRALVYEGPGAYYVNPYVGCMLACPFCYAIHRADFSRSLEGVPAGDWGRWVDVKVNLPEVLAAELTRRKPGTVRMSPIITDPYQPIERRFRITRGCVEALVGTEFVPMLLTRSSVVLRDLDVLARCTRPLVGVSVTTHDDAVIAEFEPNTENITERVATLRGLHEAGVLTFAVVQPMLPLDPAQMVEKLAPWVRAVRIGPMFEKQRSVATYKRLGKESCLEEAWEMATFEELKKRFEDRGVLVNPTGPPWGGLR